MTRNNQEDDDFKPDSNFGAEAEDYDDDFGDSEIDLSEAKEHVYQPLPRAIYPATILSIEYGLAKISGKPKLTWLFGVDAEGDDGKTHQRKVYMNDSLIPEQQGRVKAHIRTIKPDYDLKHFVPRNVGDELKDLPCRLRLDIGKPFNGKRNNEVKELLPSEEMSGAFLPVS